MLLSNRGVDDARDLRERAMYAPSEEDRFKVYILDEAHMLTREAWNALLKILEEPPPRVIFVFATTEPQKIQQTASPILSRCQRFDFRRIGVGDITRRLQEVLAGEGTEAPEEALRTIARRAEGGMRDGLSLLDQVLALTGGDVSQEAVRRVLGLVEEERYLELFSILKDREHGEVFTFVENLLEEGYDMVEFHRGLIDVLRLLLRLRLGKDDGGDALGDSAREAFLEFAEAFSPGDLVRMLAQATDLEASGSLRRSAHPRLLLEMLLLRLSYLDRTVDLEDLLRELGGHPGAIPVDPPPAPPSAHRGRGKETGKASAPKVEEKKAPGRKDDVQPEASKNASPGGAESESAAPAQAKAAVPESGKGAQPGADPMPLPRAWEALMGGAGSLPPGVLPFLMAAQVSFPNEGTLALTVVPGPGLEKLQEPTVVRALKDALAGLSGTEPELAILAATPGDRPQERITEGTVRDGKLKDLVDKEPALGEAVQELDLELLD